jgi:hypothetical protein
LELIQQPCLRIDAMGVYVLSDRIPAASPTRRTTESNT